jgi:beta-N-acetylhexosaminidase
MLNINFLILAFFVLLRIFCLAAYRADALSLEEKLGQLFVIPACPTREEDHEKDLQGALKNLFIGNFILKQGAPESHHLLIKKLRREAAQPLFFMVDAEWGLAMSLSEMVNFPKNLTLGAIQKKELLFHLGEEIGRQCRALGIHLNLAPVVDINSNPLNPIIHMRSFGERPQEVAQCGVLLMQGMMASGTLPCAKHFPGHGDTAVDSHKGLPVISCARDTLMKRELLPFKACIDKAIPAIMVGHLLVPALDERFPASLSEKIIEQLLKEELGFEGLVITDALNMKALTSLYSVEEIALRAFLAGNDLLLYGDHLSDGVDRILRDEVPRAYRALKKAYEQGIIQEEDLNARVQKILDVKMRCEPIPLEALSLEKATALKRALYREAITLLKMDETLLPLQEKRISFLSFGKTPVFEQLLRNHVEIARESDTVIIAIAEGCTAAQEAVRTLKRNGKKVILIFFTTPYISKDFPEGDLSIMAYEDDEEAQRAAFDLLFKGLEPRGELPIQRSPGQ